MPSFGERSVEEFSAAELDRFFEEIYTLYSEPIYNYVLRMMGNSLDAADFTQEAFVKAFASLQRNPRDYQIRPWLYRIATNVCLDELRRRGVIRWQALDLLTERFSFEPADKETPERLVLYKEDVENVRAILDRLSPRYKLVLLLREQQELSYEEIGTVLGKPLSAVKSLLFRARERFRRVYLEEFPDAGSQKK